MSTGTNSNTAPRQGASVDHRLARLLDAPFLARVVPHLAPETLHQLIQYRGLDACGDLVTSATPAQLTALLDLDLWRHAQPERDEQFYVDRFGEWLEVLVDTGDSVAARTVAALDEHLVILGLSRYLRVFDPGTFEPTESTDDEPMDRHAMMNSETSGDVLECDVGGYLVRARRTDAWDAIVTLLVTLGTEHHHYFHAVMQGCRRLSHSGPEIDGLDDLLTAPAQHLHDVAIERERRRSRHGYATPADARAFLQMARQPRAASATISTNPIVTAYFRAADDEADASPAGTSAHAPERGSHHDTMDVATPVFARASASQVCGNDDISASIDAVIELLAEAGRLRQGCGGQRATAERPRALLEAAGDDPGAARLPLLKRLMEFVRHHDEAAYLTRSRELTFLANTLIAGSAVQSRPFTPHEASDAAASTCNLGLDCWPARWPPSLGFGEPRRSAWRASGPRGGGPGPTSQGASSPPELETAIPPDAFLAGHDLVTAFEVGWSVLYTDVSLFVADQLVSTLADLQGADADTRLGLRALRRTLVEQREAGTPWLARDAADVLARLDITAWISVLGLLDACPILPAALTAVLERRTTPVSPTAFDFISTTAQIGDIRLFMRTLPGVLSG
jgi:hypothetical protein